MKKLPIILSTIFLVILTACGGTSNGTGPASVPQGGTSVEALPATTQLIIGTIKLDGTDQAVTAEQAAELLPLWQTMQVLSDSDTAADQEKEALIAQIQETMTEQQIKAITDLNLTREDMMSIMQAQGTTMGSGPQSSSSQSGNSPSRGDRVFGGGPPDEMPGGGGGFAGQGQNLSEGQIATAQAFRQNNENVVSPMLINAVVEYLQEKAGS
jgi:hypothetical protein